MNWAVARYALYSGVGTVVPVRGVAGRAPAGPSAACSCCKCVVVSGVPLGANGPLTDLKTGLLLSRWVACARTVGCCQTDDGYRRSRLVGLACAAGKCALMTLVPWADWLVVTVVPPPKPA